MRLKCIQCETVCRSIQIIFKIKDVKEIKSSFGCSLKNTKHKHTPTKKQQNINLTLTTVQICIYCLRHRQNIKNPEVKNAARSAETPGTNALPFEIEHLNHHQYILCVAVTSKTFVLNCGFKLIKLNKSI